MSLRQYFFWIFVLAGFTPVPSLASEWVFGTVSIVDDYRPYDPTGPYSGILLTLANMGWTNGGSAQSVCTARFRIIVGQEGMTADAQKAALSILLTARASGDRVRIYVNPSNIVSNSCAVQIVGIGDVPG